MDQFRIFLSQPWWLVPVCFVAGAAYAWLLYSPKPTWSKRLNYTLAAIRFLVVSFLCFLLLDPVIRSFANSTEKPAVVFAVDNSESVKLFSDPETLSKTVNGLGALREKLEENGIETEVKTLTPKPVTRFDSVHFNQKSTNLDGMLTSLSETYENRNLAAVVLLSDGIVNQGKSPVFSDFPFKLYPLALGDTVPKKDISLPALQYNKVAFSGNKFPIVAEIRNDGFSGQNATVLLKENGKIVAQQTVALQKNKTVQPVTFTLTAGQPGKKHYEISVQNLPGEFTKLNNTKNAYLEIVKGKLKVLLAASVPHPDIKALKSALETDDNFEVHLYLPGIAKLKPDAYDVAILHQLPARSGMGAEALQMVKSRNIPAFYILGVQSDLNAFNQQQAGVFVSPRGNQTDEVSPSLNTGFTKFGFTATASDLFTKYPPATAPFADFKPGPETETILYQQVGNLKTNKPLLVFKGGASPAAALVAEGCWQWRLNEAVANEKPVVFDKLVTDLVQLLTTKQNKKRLNVYPVQDEFLVSDDVRFQAEVYNTIFEKIYGQTINLKLTDPKNQTRNYSFVNGENLSGLSIGNLPGGIYRYVATTTADGRKEQDSGEFLVVDQELESMNAQADHQLLHQLARRNGSHLYYPSQMAQLENDLLKADFKSVIFSQESLQDLINLKWLFFVIVALVTLEWGLRKYFGAI